MNYTVDYNGDVRQTLKALCNAWNNYAATNIPSIRESAEAAPQKAVDEIMENLPTSVIGEMIDEEYEEVITELGLED